MPSSPLRSDRPARGPSRPYRGAQFYGVADRAFFHGRRDAAETTEALALSHKLSLLHALSGMGKTSLLEAQAMPMLEDRGWTTVRSRPHLDPIETLKAAIIDRVLPAPDEEVEAIAKVVSIMRRAKLDENARLAEVVARFQELARDDPDYMALQTYNPPPIQPGGADANGPEVPVSRQSTPFVTRLFQYGSGLRLLERQVMAFEILAETGMWAGDGSQAPHREIADASLGKLKTFFEHGDVRDIHASLRRTLEAPELPLVQFLQRLHAVWGAQYDSFGLVIILDQFEEIFTRYVDMSANREPAPRDAPDWELRPAFFAELGRVVHAIGRTPGLPPLRLMVCMRDDFIANLDQLTQQTGEIPNEARFHLDALTVDAARQAVTEPAKLFGVNYQPALLDTIIDSLAKEASWVEPGHIQIVCEYLWENSGRALAAEGGGTIPASAMPEASAPGRPSGVQAIISGYFDRILSFDEDGKPRSEAQQVEMLDLLDPLMTEGRTRNIMEEQRLREAPFRNVDLRASLLKEMSRHRILRTEPRLGGRFVEITHEFLIQPVLDARADLARRSENRFQWARLPQAFQRLGEIQHTFRRASGRLLDIEELSALDTFAELVDFAGHPWIAEAMFRSAIVAGLDRAATKRHLDRFEQHLVPLYAETTRKSLQKRMRDDIGLDYAELLTLVAQSDWPKAYAAPERLFMLDSVIANAWTDQWGLIEKIAKESIDE